MKFVSLDQLTKILKNEKIAAEWVDLLNAAFEEYEINTSKRVAMFIAQVGHESGDFRVLTENLNYSAAGLKRVFKKYFNDDNAEEYAGKPDKIANYVYANRMGNGDEASGDGWKYRGGGLIQLTGKSNYLKYAKKLGKSADELCKSIRSIEDALRTACLYWNDNQLSSLADSDDVNAVTKKINGGLNGVADRKKRYEEALAIIQNKAQKTKSNLPGVEELPIKNGDRGETVKLIQKMINAPDDGVFGPTTLMEVKRFQKKNGLEVTGVVDLNTFTKMFGVK